MADGQRVELYLDENGEYRWRAWSGSDKVAGSLEGYKNKAWAEYMAKQQNEGAQFIDLTESEGN